MYRLGVVPWDGHPLADSLKALIEGADALPPGKALDVGCGTGDNSIYLAQHGWQVAGVDFVAKAVEKARSKAAKQQVSVSFAQADVTHLSAADIGSGFDLIIDSGCLHGMSALDRDAYVREVTAVASSAARLHIVAFIPGGSYGVPGITPDEVLQRFSADWASVSSGIEHAMDRGGRDVARYYLFQRAS